MEIAGGHTRTGTLIWSPMPNFRYQRTEPTPGHVDHFMCSKCNMKLRSEPQLRQHELKFCLGTVPDDQEAEFYLVDEERIEEKTISGRHDDLVMTVPDIEQSSSVVIGNVKDDEASNHPNTEGGETNCVNPEVKVRYPKFHWVKCTDGLIPKYAVKVGYDYSVQSEIYVGRARVGLAKVPGRVVPAERCAYVSTRGSEVKITEYEVLTDPSDLLSWKQCATHAGIPKGSQKAGYDENKLMVFVARTTSPDGCPTCGMYAPHVARCLYAWKGKEYISDKFELLCKK